MYTEWQNITILEFAFLSSGGIFALVWGLSLLFARGDYFSKFMPALLFITGSWLLSGAYFFSPFLFEYPVFFGIFPPLQYLMAPLIFLYLKEILLKGEERSMPPSRLWPHTVPSLLAGLFMLPYLFWSHETRILYLQNPTANSGFYYFVLGKLSPGVKVFILIYLMYFSGRYREYFTNIKVYPSFVRNIIIYFICILLISVGVGLTGFVLNIPELITLSAMSAPLVVFSIYIIQARYPELEKEISKGAQKIRYSNSVITLLDIEKVMEKLENLMIREKIFSDEDLTLAKLARELEITPHQLSQLINEKLGKNFRQFINEYRVEEAKELLISDEKRTTLSIAFSVGFNSKSAFHRAFQSYTGLTPQKYRLENNPGSPMIK